MRTILNLFLIAILTVPVETTKAEPKSEENAPVVNDKALKTLDKAILVLDNILGNPVDGIPQSLIHKSEGIIIFPGACNAAAGAFNGYGGRGVALIHNADGSWSNPFFVILAGGSRGYNITSPAPDIVLLIKDRNTVINMDKEAVTLGGDFEVREGPVNNGLSFITDYTFESEIYYYHVRDGLFTRVSLDGGILAYYDRYSDLLYGIDHIKMDEIFYRVETPFNDRVNDLMVSLANYK